MPPIRCVGIVKLGSQECLAGLAGVAPRLGGAFLLLRRVDEAAAMFQQGGIEGI